MSNNLFTYDIAAAEAAVALGAAGVAESAPVEEVALGAADLTSAPAVRVPAVCVEEVVLSSDGGARLALCLSADLWAQTATYAAETGTDTGENLATAVAAEISRQGEILHAIDAAMRAARESELARLVPDYTKPGYGNDPCVKQPDAHRRM